MKEQNKFSCFKCDDGNTPLYCLNCANEKLQAQLAAAEQRVLALENNQAALRAEIRLCDDATKVREQNLAAAEQRERVLREAISATVVTILGGMESSSQSISHALAYAKLIAVCNGIITQLTSLAATGKEGEKV